MEEVVAANVSYLPRSVPQTEVDRVPVHLHWRGVVVESKSDIFETAFQAQEDPKVIGSASSLGADNGLDYRLASLTDHRASRKP